MKKIDKVLLGVDNAKMEEIRRRIGKYFAFEERLKKAMSPIEFNKENLVAFLSIKRSESVSPAKDINSNHREDIIRPQDNSVKVCYQMAGDSDERIGKMLLGYVTEKEPSERKKHYDSLMSSFAEAKEKFYATFSQFEYKELFAKMVEVCDGSMILIDNADDIIKKECSLYIKTERGINLYGRAREIASSLTDFQKELKISELEKSMGYSILDLFSANGDCVTANIVDYDNL